MKNSTNKYTIRKPKNVATDILIKYQKSKKISCERNNLSLLEKKTLNI